MTDYNLKDLMQDYKDSSSYICDAISEQADSNVDIYNDDLLEWAKDKLYEIEEANKELGTPDSIIAQIQQAQFLENERALYDLCNDDAEKKEAILNTYENEINELSENEFTKFDDLLDERLDEIDQDSTFADIGELVQELIDEARQESTEEKESL